MIRTMREIVNCFDLILRLTEVSPYNCICLREVLTGSWYHWSVELYRCRLSLKLGAKRKVSCLMAAVAKQFGAMKHFFCNRCEITLVTRKKWLPLAKTKYFHNGKNAVWDQPFYSDKNLAPVGSGEGYEKRVTSHLLIVPPGLGLRKKGLTLRNLLYTRV